MRTTTTLQSHSVLGVLTAVLLLGALAGPARSQEPVSLEGSGDDPLLNEELRRFLAEEQKSTRVLKIAGPAPSEPRRSAPPQRVTRERMDALLRGPMAGVEEIVFSVRSMGKDGHWYANFGYWSSDTNRWLHGEGAWLVRLNLRTGATTNILADAQGTARDPCVHYDGRTILFSYRRPGSHYFNLYEINADGTNLKQLTDGPWDDIEPVYAPDGGIVFCSSRCKRWVNCWYSHVAVIYRMDRDGGNLRVLSANVEHDNTPWFLPDGRVLYMRWEYIDRNQVRYHHLWTMNPDGTSQQVFFGNMHAGTAMLDAKPIPGTDKVISIFSPGHGRREHMGLLTIVDPNMGPDDLQHARAIHQAGDCRDPYAFSEDCIIVVRNSDILLMDRNGNPEILYSHPGGGGLVVHEPRPLAPRPRENAVASRSRPRELTGRLVLSDITRGRNMDGVAVGAVRKLLVLESLPKPINHSGGQDAISMGGTFTLPRVLGTVPVEPDGSAFLEVPAVRSLFLVALDDNDLSVKRMQSFLTVSPGETLSCAGCHEHRTDAPRHVPNPTIMALRRPPSRIQPFEDVPDVYDFPRHIQPILDARCGKCHGPDKRSGGILLSGDRAGKFTHAYQTMIGKGLVADGRNADGNRPPRTIGSSASPLMKRIDGSHKDLKLTAREERMIWMWIESGAPFAGTYAALGLPSAGVYRPDESVFARRCAGCHADGVPNAAQSVSASRPELSAMLLAPLAQAAGGWGRCRGEMRVGPVPGPRAAAPAPSPPPRPKPSMPRPGDRLDAGTDGVLDGLLDTLDAAPKRTPGPTSPTLATMPPPVEEPKPLTRHVETVFTDTTDPDYQKILAGIAATKDAILATQFESPAFVPPEDYVREMKRFGILPPSFDRLRDRTDVYALDQAYWRALQWPQICANP